MEGVVRVPPRETYNKIKADQALLVCGYESDARFEKYRLEGAISFNDFKARFPSLPVEQEVVFYCNCTDERSAAAQAANYMAMGYPNMEALLGGVEGWKAEGLPVL